MFADFTTSPTAPIAFLRPGDTPYPRPNPVPPLTPTGGGKNYAFATEHQLGVLKKGMWE